MRCGNCCKQFPSTEFRVRGERRVGKGKSFYRLLTTDFMTWIKICGTTNLEDALTAVDAGADALGFVFYEKSPRKIDVESAREIVGKLPARVEKVGVFVGESADQWPRVVLNVGLTSVQQYFGFEPRVQPENAKATGIDGFPVPPKIYVTLPVARFLEEEEAIKGLAADFGRDHY